MRRKAGREQEAPFFLGRATIKIKSINALSYYGLVRVRLLRSLSYAGDSKEKEYKYFFSLESGVSGGRKSPSASPQIKQKIESKLSFFIFSGASGGSRTLVSSLGRKYNSRYTTLA